MIIEYGQQLVEGDVLRKVGFMLRVRIFTKRGYCLVWVPSWRVSNQPPLPRKAERAE